MPKRVDSKRIDLTGKEFGDLTVIKLSDQRGDNNTLLWECRCSCGNTTYLQGYSLINNRYKSCGCKRISKRDAGVKEYLKKDRVDGTRLSALNSKLHKGNKSGHKGVMWNKHRNKWTATIGFKGKQIFLGNYENKEDAIKARTKAEEEYHEPYIKALEEKLSPQNKRDKRVYRNKIDITSNEYGMLTVIEEVEQVGTKRRWLCKCKCGNKKVVLMDSLRSGNTRSCGCNKPASISKANAADLSKQRFGRLTVIKRNNDKKNAGHVYWECLCDCGNTVIVDSSNLKSGNTKSCGCMKFTSVKER